MLGGLFALRRRQGGDLLEGKLQGNQRLHIVGVGGTDILIHIGRRHHRVQRLEGLQNFRRIHAGVLCGQPEHRQQRRLGPVDPAQLFGPIPEISVRDHCRFPEIILPLIDEIGVVAGAQVLFQPGILLDAGSRSEYPFLAVKERVGVPNGVLHERPSGLGVGARHIFVVDHHFGRAGELAVEIHRWVVLVRLRQHQRVNAER